MTLFTWFRGRRDSAGWIGSRILTARVTMLTVLERRQMQRARRAAAVREAVEAFIEAQHQFWSATDLEAIEAAGRDFALAAAELQSLHELPHH